MRFLILLIAVGLLGLGSWAAEPPAAAPAESAADEAHARFTYKGKPIHPGCLREFEVWMSDGPPPRVISVDVDSCVDSDKNTILPEEIPGGWLTARSHDPQSREWCAYKHLGRTASGTHVVATRLASEGTLVATYVYLLRFGQEEYHMFRKGSERPALEKRLALKCVGQIGLGDRDNGTVELRGDTLVLGKSRNREHEEQYELP